MSSGGEPLRHSSLHDWPLGLVGASALWIFSGVAGATVSSRVIYGLRERALEAMALGRERVAR